MPQGSSSFSSRNKSFPKSRTVHTKSACTTDVVTPPIWDCRSRWLIAAVNKGIFSTGKLNPAAKGCPPKRCNRCAWSFTNWYKSTELAERAEPRANKAGESGESVLNKIVGRPVSLATCPATNPNTPTDHWASSKTMTLVVDRSSSFSFCATC